MNRLTHSDAGFLRSLQISNARLFAFVEGGLDRPFVARMIGFAFPNKTWPHQVIAIKEFPSAAGGKVALFDLFRVLRAKGQLSFTAFGKPMVCIVFADKDIDDVLRKKLRSPHALYTPTYDVEGLLFLCSDLHSAVADACLVTPAQASTLIGNGAAWVRASALRWKEWVCLAMLSHTKQINVGCGYRQASSVNPNLISPTDAGQLANLMATIRTELGMTPVQFRAAYKRFEKRFDASLAAEPLRYFKGKWLQQILQRHLEAQPRIPDSNIAGAGERVVTALVGQAGNHAGCQCCAPFAVALQALCPHL